ncbi:MAG: 4Fe-4S single cluster domain-containing protein [Bryobacteraceae bacterium]
MLIHAIVPGNRVNGPGFRAVVYFQGCTMGCRLCWNPETHPFSGEERSIDETVSAIVLPADEERPFEGVTFSGGEPMQQAEDLLALIKSIRCRQPALSFGMYSGYSEQELSSGRYWCRTELPQVARQELWYSIRQHLDFAVLGRYVAERPSARPLRTSANQKLKLFSDRYSEQDFEPQEIEVHIAESGLVQVTGFPVAGTPV